jgi:RNA recognition motif-containing protein
MKIFVGNLSADTTETELNHVFSEYGEIESVKIVFDKLTGESRKFGYVLMPNDHEALKAIQRIREQPVKGRHLVINEARRRIKRREENNRRSGPPNFHD